jgi:hypothetical protein
MRLFIFSAVLLLSSFLAFSQSKKFTYIQFDVAVAIKGNQDRGETDLNSNTNNLWFLPNGLSSKLGYGIHHNKWISLGIHSGIDWKWTDKLVVVPVFANLKLSPRISEDTRIALQLGLGKALALGRGDLIGDYKKISLGVQTPDDLIIFIELSHYGISIINQKDNGSVSLGLSLITF